MSFRKILGMPNVESVRYSITLNVRRCKVLSVSAGCVQDISKPNYMIRADKDMHPHHLPHRILLSRTVSVKQTGRYGSTRIRKYSEHCTVRTSGIGFRFSILLQSTVHSKFAFSFVNLYRSNDELNSTALSAIPSPK